MARRKNSTGSAVIIIIGLVLVALASIPVEAWEVMGVVVGIIFFLWILFKLFAAEKKEIKSLSKSEREFNPGITISLKTHETGNEWDEPVTRNLWAIWKKPRILRMKNGIGRCQKNF